MKTIFKYPLEVLAIQKVALPTGAEILSVQLQEERLCMWALVDTDILSTEERYFRIVATGNPLEFTKEHFVYTFLATIQIEKLVFHVFEMHS